MSISSFNLGKNGGFSMSSIPMSNYQPLANCWKDSSGSWYHHETECEHKPIEIVEMEIRDVYKFESRRLKINESYYLCIFLKDNVNSSTGNRLLTFINQYFPLAKFVDPESKLGDLVQRQITYYFSNHEPLWTKENFPYVLVILLVEY